MAVTGNPLSTFTDLMKSTPAMQASGIEEFAMYLPEKTWLLNAMQMHGELDKKFFKGVEVKDQFVDDVQMTGNYRRPNGEFTYSLPQHFKEWTSYPSLFLDYVAWTQWEMEQNGIVRDLRGGALRERMKNLRSQKLRMQKVNQARQFESDLLAEPNYTTMENSQTYYKPRSLFCYVNEGIDTAVWPTLQGIDTSVVTEYQCERVATDYTGTGAAWLGFEGLDILTANVVRDKIPFANVEQTPQGPARHELLVSSWGYQMLQTHIRQSNDHLRLAGADPGIRGAQFDGIPIRRLTTLDDRTVWTKAGTGNSQYSGGTEYDATVTGPRFILMDYAAYEARFHEMMKFYNHPVREHPRTVGTQVMPIETWWMALSMDPRTCGVLSPATSVTPPSWVTA